MCKNNQNENSNALNCSNKRFKNDYDKAKTKMELHIIDNSSAAKQSTLHGHSSVSPSSVSTNSSSSSYSVNSSPSSFIFEASMPNNTTTTTSIISKENKKDKEKANHPLLALQMFVNGSSGISEECNSPTLMRIPTANITSSNSIVSKLPAKKRPYKEKDDAESENNEADGDEVDKPKKYSTETHAVLVSPMRCLSENVSSENSLTDRSVNYFDSKSELVQKEMSTSSPSKCQPLHLLQKMHLDLDSYYFR